MKPRLFLSTLICCMALALPSCRDRGPLAPDPGIPIQAGSGAGSPHGLLPCRPLAYDSATVRVGAQGATIRVSRHVLSIPPRALARPVDITVVAPPDTVNRLEFRPEGLIFRVPATLTLSYVNCSQSVQSKGIAYTNDSLVIVEYLPADDDAVGKDVTGPLSHFSSYAVSW